MPPARRIALTLLLAAAAAVPAAGQFTQYVRPGGFAEKRVSTKELLDEAIRNARWEIGRLRADPWLGLREIAYDDNVGGRPEDPRSDLTATLGFGVRAYLPVGEDLILAGHLLPEYVWWREREEARRLNGRAGVGLFGDVGSTALELSVSRLDEARFFSRELEDQVNTRDEVGALAVETDLWRGLSVFTAGRLRRLRFRDEDPGIPPVRVLDRDETVVRAGLRHTFRRGLSVGLGVERSEADFESGDSIRDNSGDSPVLELEYAGPSLSFGADVVARDLEFDQAPEPIDFDEVTGSLRVAWSALDRFALQLYSRRDLVYSFTGRWAYFEDRVSGAAVVARLGAWGRMRIFGETGTNDYQPILGTFVPRRDDFDGYGLGLELGLGRVTVRLEASRTDFESNLPEFDRDVTIIRSGLVFGESTLSPWA